MDLLTQAAEFVGRYERAQAFRRAGDLYSAELALLPSVNPPSEFHGHYRELFKVYRAWNKRDLSLGRWSTVIDRVTNMLRLDDEMVRAMEDGFHRAHGEPPGRGVMDSYRKLLVGDAKAMLRAAEALGDNDAKRVALDACLRFPVSPGR